MRQPYIFVLLASTFIVALFTSPLSLELVQSNSDVESSIIAKKEIQLVHYYQRKDTNMVCLDGCPNYSDETETYDYDQSADTKFK